MKIKIIVTSDDGGDHFILQGQGYKLSELTSIMTEIDKSLRAGEIVNRQDLEFEQCRDFESKSEWWIGYSRFSRVKGGQNGETSRT